MNPHAFALTPGARNGSGRCVVDALGSSLPAHCFPQAANAGRHFQLLQPQAVLHPAHQCSVRRPRPVGPRRIRFSMQGTLCATVAVLLVESTLDALSVHQSRCAACPPPS